MDEFGAPKFRRLGTNVLIVDAAGVHRLENQQRIWRLHAGARSLDGVRESVPGMNNLTLLYDERVASFGELERQMRELWENPGSPNQQARTTHAIEVRYGGSNGPDLADVAAASHMSERDVVALHTSREYVVYFIGFQPGFAYLGDLDERLHLPRRQVPRAAVQAGSVAIALNHTAIYPFASPGGWHVIGHTDTQVFDPARGSASFAPGDRVCFREAR